jgi:hypothetical protein
MELDAPKQMCLSDHLAALLLMPARTNAGSCIGLGLMNACANDVMNELGKDVVLGYGQRCELKLVLLNEAGDQARRQRIHTAKRCSA